MCGTAATARRSPRTFDLDEDKLWSGEVVRPQGAVQRRHRSARIKTSCQDRHEGAVLGHDLPWTHAARRRTLEPGGPTDGQGLALSVRTARLARRRDSESRQVLRMRSMWEARLGPRPAPPGGEGQAAWTSGHPTSFAYVTASRPVASKPAAIGMSGTPCRPYQRHSGRGSARYLRHAS